MDQVRFDFLARSVGAAVSRRAVASILTAASLGTLATVATQDVADARKKGKKKRGNARCTPNCSDRTCGNDGCGGSCGVCEANQICHRGACCRPEPRNATCAGRCGTRINNCGQQVECSNCPDGRVCLSNGSCAVACTDNNDCPSLCGKINTEGNRHCVGGLINPITTCTGTVDCPIGSHCEDMGGGGICIALVA